MTPTQAERAVANQHGAYLNGETLISVQLMDPLIAKKMNLQLARDGSLLMGNGSGAPADGLIESLQQQPQSLRRRTRTGAEGQVMSSRYRVPDDDHDEDADTIGAADGSTKLVRGDDLYLKPYRRKNICERIVEYFFAY